MTFVFNDIYYKSQTSHTRKPLNYLKVLTLLLVTLQTLKSNHCSCPLYSFYKIIDLNFLHVIIVEATTLPALAVFDKVECRACGKIGHIEKVSHIKPKKSSKKLIVYASINLISGHKSDHSANLRFPSNVWWVGLIVSTPYIQWALESSSDFSTWGQKFPELP